MEEIMGTEFKEIKNIKEYLLNEYEKGLLQPKEYVKSARIKARKGIAGEKISTIVSGGLHETDNIVTVDHKTGKPGWVVTGKNGEEYIVSDSVFCEKYKPVEGIADTYAPKGQPIIAVKVNENISFMAPWEEKMNIISGGYIVISNSSDIYGVQEKEFCETYMLTGKSIQECSKMFCKSIF